MPGCFPQPDGVDGPFGSIQVEPQISPEQTFLLNDPMRVIRLYDDQTDLVMKQVHPVYQATGLTPFIGVPYVRVGNSCLEIIDQAVVRSGDYVFEISKGDCPVESRGYSDYVDTGFASCNVTVRASRTTSPTELAAIDHESLFSLADRFVATIQKPVGEGFIALRSTGTEMGSIDRSVTPERIGARAGLDIVTPFGVANVDFEYRTEQAIGAQREVTIGPQVFTLTIVDIGNTNTHCDPSCTNVFDVAVVARTTSESAPVLVLMYE